MTAFLSLHDSLAETELAVLRDLHARTEVAHRGKAMPHVGAE